MWGGGEITKNATIGYSVVRFRKIAKLNNSLNNKFLKKSEKRWSQATDKMVSIAVSSIVYRDNHG